MTVDELITALQAQSAVGNGALDARYGFFNAMGKREQCDIGHLRILDCEWETGKKIVDLTEYLPAR